MRIVFAGTPDFAKIILKALNHSKHQIIGVYCQPDSAKGRGRILSPCAVKNYANAQNLALYQPENLTDINTQKQLAKLAADIMVVVAYGQILPKAVLNIPKKGCVNIHASILPRWRGAAPIQRAILAGDKTTGISIIQMDEGLDTGDILLQQSCVISDDDNAQTLHDRLAILGAQSIIRALDKLTTLTPEVQNQSEVTYAKKLFKNESWINWQQSAVHISRKIRAFNPYPIAQCYAEAKQFDHKVLRILAAKVINQNSNQEPGTVVKYKKGGCDIATGKHILRLKQVQLPNKNIVDIDDFIHAYQLIKLK